MKHLLVVWFFAVILAGCIEGVEQRKKEPVTVQLSEEQQFRQWQKIVLTAGSRWTSPPVWEYRVTLMESNSEYTKYKLNPLGSGYYYITVRNDSVIAVWSTLNMIGGGL